MNWALTYVELSMLREGMGTWVGKSLCKGQRYFGSTTSTSKGMKCRQAWGTNVSEGVAGRGERLGWRNGIAELQWRLVVGGASAQPLVPKGPEKNIDSIREGPFEALRGYRWEAEVRVVPALAPLGSWTLRTHLMRWLG